MSDRSIATGSGSSAAVSDAPLETCAPERTAPAIGALVVIVALSSLLDDTGVLDHPWWVPVALGAAALAAALVVRTIHRLLHP